MTTQSAGDRYAVGLQLFQAGNYQLAERSLRDVLTNDPEHHLSLALLALTLINLGQSRDALAAANASLAVMPNVDGLRARAIAKLELADLPGSVAAAGDAVRLMPSSAMAAKTFAWTLEKSKRMADAEVQYRRSAELAPSDEGFRAEYGRFLLRRKRLTAAEAVMRDITPNVELNAVVLLRGEVALARGRLEDARELALWILSRDARHQQAIRLLTLATANRNPLLKLWWRNSQIMLYKPIWQRVLWMGMLLAIGMTVAGLPILFFAYIFIARKFVDRQVKAELTQVRLSQAF